MSSMRQVFFNSDERGITLLSVAVYTLLKTNDPAKPIALYIAHNTAFAEAGCIDRIRAIVARFPFARVSFVDCAPVFEQYKEVFSKDGKPVHLLWAFPLCDKLFPEVTGKIVYIDIDMLIRRDLGELFDLDLAATNSIAAAVNESRREHRRYLCELGWPEEAGYSFNNATTVLDLDAFRRERLSDAIIAWYGANKQAARSLDQDSQNVVYGARTLRIPPKWNYTDGWLERIFRFNPFAREWRVFPPNEMLEAILDPAIIHYIGKNKPTSWTHRPERRAFRQALKELDLLENGRLPGETNVKILVGLLFDGYHALLKAYARLLLTFRRCFLRHDEPAPCNARLHAR